VVRLREKRKIIQGGAGGSLSFGEGEEKNQTVGGWRLPCEGEEKLISFLGFLFLLPPLIAKFPPFENSV
jgi:hypothetical protein